MATFASVFTALDTQLQTLVGTGGNDIVQVKYPHKADLTGFPAITFDVSDNSSDFLTQSDNVETISFQIAIWQTIKIKGEKAATDILNARTDEVVALLRATDGNMAGAVDWSILSPGRRIRVAVGVGDAYVQFLTFQCFYSVSTN